MSGRAGSGQSVCEPEASGTERDKESRVLHGPALILQTRTYPQYLKPHPTRVPTVAQFTFHTRPAPEGKLDPLDETPGNYTIWCWRGASDRCAKKV